jgi:hypothetical protein
LPAVGDPLERLARVMDVKVFRSEAADHLTTQ